MTLTDHKESIASAGRDTDVRIWDAQTGAHLRTLKGHSRMVYTVTFSPDGKTLASGSRDGTLLLWDLTLI